MRKIFLLGEKIRGREPLFPSANLFRALFMIVQGTSKGRIQRKAKGERGGELGSSSFRGFFIISVREEISVQFHSTGNFTRCRVDFKRVSDCGCRGRGNFE